MHQRDGEACACLPAGRENPIKFLPEGQIFLDKKAQSLTEMAIFGGLLLLVLSYFIRWGIGLTYQQDVQMRAFRMALSDAVNDEYGQSDAETMVALSEDKLNIDPRNMVGKGDFINVANQGNVVWGNTLHKPMTDQFKDVPRIKYVINGAVRTYSLAMMTPISNAMQAELFVYISEGQAPIKIQWQGAGNELRCYKPKADSPKQARILISEAEKKTEIVIDVAEVRIVDGQPSPGPKWRIVDLPENLNNGDPVNILTVIMPENGNINANFTSLDYVREQADQFAPLGEPDSNSENKLQGLLPYTKMETKRKESVHLEEIPGGSGYTKSTTDFDTTESAITHYIRLNTGQVFSFPYSPAPAVGKGKWTWQSAK